MARGTGPPPPPWGGLGSSGSHGRGSPDAGAPQEPPWAGQGGETWLRTRQGKAAESRRGRKPHRGLFGKPLSQLDAAAREQPAEPTCEVPACPAPREMLPARQTPAGLSPRGADAARAVPAPGAAAPPQPQGAERHRGSAEPRGAAEPTGGGSGGSLRAKRLLALLGRGLGSPSGSSGGDWGRKGGETWLRALQVPVLELLAAGHGPLPEAGAKYSRFNPQSSGRAPC